jgi:hypothetical protein
MPKTLKEILDMTWQRQAEELRNLSRLELEVLFFEINRAYPPSEGLEAFDRFYLAVFSIIRDRREWKNPAEKGCNGPGGLGPGFDCGASPQAP